MLIANQPNLREVTAFPLNQQAQELLGAPSPVDDKQLKELHLHRRSPRASVCARSASTPVWPPPRPPGLAPRRPIEARRPPHRSAGRAGPPPAVPQGVVVYEPPRGRFGLEPRFRGRLHAVRYPTAESDPPQICYSN